MSRTGFKSDLYRRSACRKDRMEIKPFADWLYSSYPEEMQSRKITDISRDTCISYLNCMANGVRDKRSYNARREFVSGTFSWVNKVFGFDIRLSETVLDDPYEVICPDCGRPADYVDSSVIYGKSYGMVYLCPLCRSHVGTHKGTSIPLGTLADQETQKYRKYVHSFFDRMWKENDISRTEAYRWLAESMGLPRETAHIGMFSEDQCKKALALIGKVENTGGKGNV